MVDGAAYYLLCHDDIALDPDAVHLLVEEAFRSNAGVVSPKVVSWDDPEPPGPRRAWPSTRAARSSTGCSPARSTTASTTPSGTSSWPRGVHPGPGRPVRRARRVRPGHRGHGRGPRPVLAGPGGRGPDHRGPRRPGAPPGGAGIRERTLDPAWSPVSRATGRQATRARATRATRAAGTGPTGRPAVRTRSDAGRRDASRPCDGAGPRRPPPGDPPGAPAPPRAPGRLQVLLPEPSLRVVPQVLVLAVGEVVVAELAGNRARARAVVRAWRWNLGRLGAIRPDGRRSRPNGGWGTRRSACSRCAAAPGSPPTAGGCSSTGSTARTPTNWRPQPRRRTRSRRPTSRSRCEAGVAATEAGRVTGRVRLVAWLTATLIVVIGSRGVLTGRLPAVGQFTPFPGWSSTFAQFFAGWHPSGVGTTAPAAPALAIAGVLGAPCCSAPWA